MSTIKTTFVLIISLLFLGCEMGGNNSPDSDLNTIKITVQEGYNPPGSESIPQTKLIMQTDSIYSCVNYGIQTEIEISSSEINIQMGEIKLDGDICLTALGPATSSLFLDLSEGEYVLNIIQKGVTDKYKIMINDSSIITQTIDAEFSKPDFPVFLRYPENSFAYLCGSTIADSSICTEFLDTLSSHLNLKNFSFPDSGKRSFPLASQGHYYDMPAKYFIYISETDFDKAEDILKDFTIKNIPKDSGIGISLINWKNKGFYSWRYN